MRNTLLTLGTWVILDRLCVYCAGRAPSSEKTCSKTPETCRDILREIAEAEFPLLTDAFQLLNDSNREILEDRLRQRLHSIEEAVFAQYETSAEAVYDAIYRSNDQQLQLLAEEIKVAIDLALAGGKRAPTMPSLLGYPETLGPAEEEETFALIDQIYGTYRSRLVKLANEMTYPELQVIGPQGVERLETYAFPPAFEERARIVLREAQQEKLAELGQASKRRSITSNFISQFLSPLARATP